MSEVDAYLTFQRAQFKTKLPHGRLYTAGHMWLRRSEGDLWHVGLTRFALRMLGEPVEFDFPTEVGAQVQIGDSVGWMEGFKAVTELYSPMAGRFAGGNPTLDEGIRAVHTSPYERGWLFALDGVPGEDCVDTDGYAGILDATIDRMLAKDAVDPDAPEVSGGGA